MLVFLSDMIWFIYFSEKKLEGRNLREGECRYVSSVKAIELRFSDSLILVTRQFVWWWFLIIVLLLSIFRSLVQDVSSDQQANDDG